jgi:homoserine kinase
MTRARAFAPGSIGNIGPGLDVLGCALTGSGDTIVVERVPERGVKVLVAGHPDLPTDPKRHASAIAANEVLRVIGATDGVTISLEKGLPLAGGQGGSAASAVVGAAATNAAFGDLLTRNQVLAAALVAEATVAGRHADNLSAALYGGIILVRCLDPLDIVELPVPDALRVVIAHPEHHRLSTADARKVLPKTVELKTVVHQMAQVAAMVAALHSGDLALLGRALEDRIAEPARKSLLPGFAEAKRAALDAGALGCSISGAGPSAFALCNGDESGARVSQAMHDAYVTEGVPCDVRVTTIDRQGVRVERA